MLPHRGDVWDAHKDIARAAVGASVWCFLLIYSGERNEDTTEQNKNKPEMEMVTD